MILSELMEILATHDQNREVKIAKNRVFPHMTDVRGIVVTGGNNHLYICEDYNAVKLESDPWQELDGPLTSEKGESYDD